MKKLILLLTAILLLAFFLILIIIAIVIPVGNNIIASRTASELVDLPLPEKTELIDYTSKAGKLTVNGNGMQYFGAIVIKSELSIIELENFYSEHRSNEYQFILAEQNGARIEIIDHGKLFFDKLKSINDFSGYYIVYTWGSNNGYFWDFDLRGH